MGNKEIRGSTPGREQKQLQISKQKQMQDQAYSYGTMGNYFSALEWYANRSALANNKKGLDTIRFEHYDNFECGKRKTLNELRMQIITQFEIYKASYFVYIAEHGQYDFPESLSKETIISLIKQWRNYVEEKDYILYDSILKVLDGDKTVSLIQILEKELEKNGGNGKVMNPKDLIDMTKIVGKSQQMGENINEQLKKDPNFKPDMKLDQKEVGNKDIQKVGNEYDERKQLEDNIKEKIEKIVTFIERKLDIKDSTLFNKEEENNDNNKPKENVPKTEDNNKKEDNKNEQKITNEMKLEDEIKELSQIVNKYQKEFNDYYYKDTENGLNVLIVYCRDTLKKESDEKKNTELSQQIDELIKLLNNTKPDSES